MIKEHDLLVLKTLEGQDITFEVNYSEDPEIKDCKIFRLKVGELVFHVKRDDLVSLLMVMGDASSQKKLIPTRIKNVKRVERRLHATFKCQKDYRAGEVIEVILPWIDEVPTEDEVFAGNLNNRKPKLYGRN